jgi:hypothetical protein
MWWIRMDEETRQRLRELMETPMRAPKRRWLRLSMLAVALCLFVAWAVFHLYVMMALVMVLAGVTLYVGLLLAGDWLVRKCIRKKAP